MLVAKNLINKDIPTLKTSDSAEIALQWMDEFKVFQLPIVNNIELLGVISESDILSMPSTADPIGSYSLSLLRPYINQTEHIYEVIKTVTALNLSVLPVVDEQQKYLGVISLRTLINKVSEMASITEPGGLIVLRTNTVDYSLSEIAQIVESNDAKILSSYITSGNNSLEVEVTIKINKEDLSAILQTFGRYNYTVVASYHHSEYEEDLKKRLESFINYLNM